MFQLSDTEKRSIRSKILKLREALTPVEWKDRSARIRQRLLRSKVWQEANHIALYHSVKKEVDTTGLIEAAWEEQKLVYLPKCEPKRRLLTFYRIDSFDQLEVVYYGLPEPDPARCAPLEMSQLDLAVVPGLAFDRQGYRLGYGGGYYDRFLAGLPDGVITLSLAFQFQVWADPLPRDTYDLPVHTILTETEWIDCQGVWD